jgi:hypothetical protein
MKNDRNFGCALPSPSEQKLLMTSILRHQVYVIIREVTVSLENSWRDSMSHFYAFFMPTVDIRTYRNNKQATTNHTIVISSHNNNNKNNNKKIIQIIIPPESHYYYRRRHHLQYRHLKMSWPSCLAYRVFSNPSLIKVGRVGIAICAER